MAKLVLKLIYNVTMLVLILYGLTIVVKKDKGLDELQEHECPEHECPPCERPHREVR